MNTTSRRKYIYIVAILIVVAVILFFVIRSVNQNNGAMVAFDKNKFIADFKAWLKKKEGGESSNKKDSASSNSWPNGVHTNIGVTKSTFEANSTKCGYPPTYEVFKKMSPGVWWCNYQGYLNEGLKWSNNFILAVYMSQWYWGSGEWDAGIRHGINWVPRVNDILNSNVSDRNKLKQLVELRKFYFRKKVDDEPDQIIFLNGWQDKQDEFYGKYSKYLAA